MSIFTQNDKYRGIEVHTTNTFQGFGRAVIFYDFVIAQGVANVDFVADDSRNVVATTRHTSALVMVGDFNCMESSDYSTETPSRGC